MNTLIIFLIISIIFVGFCIVYVALIEPEGTSNLNHIEAYVKQICNHVGMIKNRVEDIHLYIQRDSFSTDASREKRLIEVAKRNNSKIPNAFHQSNNEEKE
jgi:hypothetical protein